MTDDGEARARRFVIPLAYSARISTFVPTLIFW